MAKTSQVAEKTKPARTADDPTMVSTAVGEPIAVAPSGAGCSLAFALLFHGDSEPAEISWTSEHPAILMLADLLPASGAALAGEAGGVLLATVDTPLAALVLTTRVQKLVESYTRHPASGLRGTCIAVTAKALDGNGPPAFLRAQAQPGQILLVGEMRRQMEALPGVRLRKSATQAPFQTAAQRLEIHELVFPYTIPPAAKVSRSLAATPAPAPIVTGPKPVVPTAQRDSVGPLPVRRIEPEEDAPTESGGRRNLILGVAAAVVLAAIGIGVKMSSKPAAAPVAAPAAAVETVAPAPVETAPAAKTPVAPRVVPPVTKPVAVEKAAAPVAEPRPAAAAKPEKPEKADNVVPIRGSAFTAEQLRSILDKAEQYAADGHYDQAIRNFDQVLANDPGNQRAKQGRERARTNKEMQ